MAGRCGADACVGGRRKGGAHTGGLRAAHGPVMKWTGGRYTVRPSQLPACVLPCIFLMLFFQVFHGCNDTCMRPYL